MQKAKKEQVIEEESGSDPFFVDKWCAFHIRRVSFCEECLHYKACLAAGASLAPSAKARKEAQEAKKLLDQAKRDALWKGEAPPKKKRGRKKRS